MKAYLSWTRLDPGVRTPPRTRGTALGASAGGRGGSDGSTRRPPQPRRQGNPPQTQEPGAGGQEETPRGQSPPPPPFPSGRGVPGTRSLGPRRREGKKHLRLTRPFPDPSAPLTGEEPPASPALRLRPGQPGAQAPRPSTSHPPPNPAPPRSLPRPTDLGKARTSVSPSLAGRSAEDKRGFARSRDPLSRRRLPRLPSPTPYNLITRNIK